MNEPRFRGSEGGSDRGVSPMIGVGMMVAIAVLLATVVGVFTITVGTAPDAQLSFSEAGEDDDEGTVTLHHDGGETIDLEDFSVIVDGSATGASLSGELSAGESRSLATGITDFDGDGPAAYEIELRHDSSSSTMLSETVPVEV
ncbi:type IV pilin N-terminal domain-containing protein [Halalkalicoccus tibetensis]|uniref:Type IV pilin N-terminal domain-containing protein n=1 Tax=Halalkalicoccus tibetensis TaxID=175632 RepID=A0ABD5V4N4_9EURY